MGVWIDLYFRKVRATESAVQGWEIRILQLLPTLHDVHCLVFDGCRGLGLRVRWFRIGLPNLAVQDGDFAIYFRQRYIVGRGGSRACCRFEQRCEFFLEGLNGVARRAGGLVAQLVKLIANGFSL